MHGVIEMILCADIGNSSIDFCIYEDTGKRRLSFKIATDRAKSRDEYAVIMESVFRLNSFDPRALTGAMVGSVAPDLTRTVSDAIVSLCGVLPLCVGPGIKTSLDIKSDNPAEVGADIVANAVAALALFSAPVIVADLGTATTILAIDAHRRLTDGYILPGVYSSYAALTRDAAEIPCVPLFPPKSLSGKNTASSVNVGVVYSAVYALDGFISLLQERLGDAPVVATGSAAGLIVPLCKHEIAVHEHLTCDGLYQIYLKNRTN